MGSAKIDGLWADRGTPVRLWSKEFRAEFKIWFLPSGRSGFFPVTDNRWALAGGYILIGILKIVLPDTRLAFLSTYTST